MLSRKTFVGENVVPTIGWLQQTRAPGDQSSEELISTSYFAAPGTGSHESCGSNVSGSARRSRRLTRVEDGQIHRNDVQADSLPRLRSASKGVTLQ